MIAGVDYVKIDDQGLHIQVNDKPQILDVDHIILCAGQEPFKDLLKGLGERNIKTHLIGGADVASELDAKRAIRQGADLASII
jgi:2,4-dienoyl-CoA reductase (NADPH2)